MKHRYKYLIISLMLMNCSSSGFSIYSKMVFNEPPIIVIRDGEYFIRFQYSEKAFIGFIESKIEFDKLIFYLPVTTSSGDPGSRYQEQAIKDPKKIYLIKELKVFWEEPTNELIPMKIVHDNGQLIKAYYKITR